LKPAVSSPTGAVNHDLQTSIRSVISGFQRSSV
jgi:hypothetical protein